MKEQTKIDILDETLKYFPLITATFITVITILTTEAKGIELTLIFITIWTLAEVKFGNN